jgi:ribosome-associated protein
MVKTAKDPLVAKLTKTLKSKKAQDIAVLDMRETGQNVCDYFIICHGQSGVQAQGIAENTIRELRKEEGLKPFQVEGLANAEWILIDYGNVVAHIFREDTREFYRLEDLWADAMVSTV